MARDLIEVARREEPDIKISVFALPEKGERQDEDGRDVWGWELLATAK